MAVNIDAHGATDVGRVRRRNADQFLVADLAETMQIQSTSVPMGGLTRLDGTSHGHLYAVADGVGLARNADVASELAVDTIIRRVLNLVPWFFYLDGESETQLRSELGRAFQQCESVVQEVVGDEPCATAAATTLTLAYLYPPQLFLVHVGDSRCYLYADGELQQLTTDHTLAQQLARSDGLADEGHDWNHLRNVLSQAIGGPETRIDPEVRQMVVWAGDTILLCTDGLTDQVSEREIESVLRTEASAEEVCRQLIKAANRAGGDDNVTVVVVRLCA